LVEKHRSIPANLISALARFDEAVARQAAGLCHNAGIDLASKDWQLLLRSAPPQVQNGFAAFLRTLPVE
jgi:hypothetical protein